MNFFKITFLVLFIVVAPYLVFSQQDISFRHYSIEEGLSQISCHDILQDKKGFLWIATQDGLNRFDGYQFKVYKHNPNDSISLSDNFIFCLEEGSNSKLWVGLFRSGINILDLKTGVIERLNHQPNNKNSLSSNNIKSILKDKNGRVWVGTDKGLDLYNPELRSFTHYKNIPEDNNSLVSNKITSIMDDKEGNLWIGTQEGLSQFNPDTEVFKNYKNNSKSINDLSNDWINVLFIDKKSNLWLGGKNGLSRLNKEDDTFEHYTFNATDKSSFSDNDVRSILELQNGKFFVGTWNGGLNLLNPPKKTFIRYLHNSENPNSISNNQVESLYEDKSGKIWIGTWTGGLNLYNPQEKQFYLERHDPNNANSLSENTVLSILEDEENNLWIGTLGGGLNYYNLKTRQFVHFIHNPNNKNSLINNSILGIFQSEDGRFWIATNDGLDLYDPNNKKFTHFVNDPNNLSSLSSNRVRRIIKGKEGKLWIGTFNGLNLYDPKTGVFTHYKHNPNDLNSLRNNIILFLLRDKLGRLWVGTNGGLSQFIEEKNHFINYFHDPKDSESLSNNSINHISEDNDGNFWIASYGGGINYFNTTTKKVKRFRQSDGILPTDGCSCVLSDDKGFKWVSTVNGFLKFNPETNEVYHFDEKDGLQGLGFNVSVCLKTQSGLMVFGGIKGFNYFHPDSIKQSKYHTEIQLSEFKLFNKKVPLAYQISDNHSIELIYYLPENIEYLQKLILPHNAYVMSFEYTALDFGLSERNNYKYKLVGFDREWNMVGNQRKATYTNLSPGNYTLEVKGTNNDGVWSRNELMLPIVIIPPWYLTKLAKFILIILVFGVPLSVYWIRVSILKKQKKELEFQVKKRTELISNQNEEIISQRDKIEIAYNNIALLNQIGKQITSHLSLEKIIDVVYENINKIMDAPEFGIGIYDETNNQIIYRHFLLYGKAIEEFSVPLTQPNRLAVYCITHNKEIFMGDIQNEYNKYISNLNSYQSGELFNSIICLPLISNNRIFGILSVQSDNKNAYTRNHLNILRNLSVYVSIALENFQAYEKLNITLKDFKKAQSNLIQSEKMASLGILTAGVAHEINNPVNFVSSGARSLETNFKILKNVLNQYEGLDPLKDIPPQLKKIANYKAEKEYKEVMEELDGLVEGVLNGAERTSEIVRSLRTFSRLDENEVKSTDIHDSIDSALVILRKEYKDKINIIKNYGKLPSVECYPAKLNQVFMNIIMNAIQAIEGSGNVIISTSVVNQSNKEIVKISFKDDGKGIKSCDIDKIFEPFFTTKEIGKGTGLGLSISYGIIKDHNGDIEVKTKEKVGTEFIITMPINQNKA